jgi:transcriptional regulator with XRE-family HTH domain
MRRVTGAPFATKLTLVLKALSMSRGRLAAELGVDKSVVSRWASGAVTPSALNLESLTKLIASRREGFTLLDWDRDLPALAKQFGVDPTVEAPGPPPTANLFAALYAPLLDAAHKAPATQTASYEGFWRAIFPGTGDPYVFLNIHGMIRRAESGVLEFRGGVFGMKFEGVILLLEGKLFMFAMDHTARTPALFVLNGVTVPRVTRLDGLCLSAAADAGRTPLATPVVLDRLGDLSGDREADDAACEELFLRNPIPAPHKISEQVRDHLVRDIGPEAVKTGGELLLMSSLTRSLSTGMLGRPGG